jgi:hypothetical protein
MELLRLIGEILGIILGFVALYLAIRHLREIRPLVYDLKTQVKLAKDHTDKLDSIRSAMPTHPIGPFPDCIRHIASLMEKANKEIIILCDFPAYGSFSAPHDFLPYRQVIEQKIDKGLKVEITCLKSERRIDLIHEQFSKGEREWETWKRRHVQEFLKAHHRDVTVEELTYTQFTSFLEEENLRILRMFREAFTKDDAKIHEVDAHIPIYFWIVDDSAIFTIPIFSKTAIEHGFQTSDKDIIRGFRAIRDRYLRGVRSDGGGAS